jgi:hypothetical protein
VFQLILGISLSVIFLFVITLLLTEVAATYPMSNKYERNIFVRFNDFMFRNAADRNKARLLLVVLSCILGLCITLYIISNAASSKAAEEQPVYIANKTTVPVVTASFKDTLAEYSLSFLTRTKWEDGKIYCNNYVHFDGNPIWSFKDWSFYLLDKDGFLVKKFSFPLAELMFETKDGGRITGMIAKCNGELSQEEYAKIHSLEVVLDKKKVSPDLQ